MSARHKLQRKPSTRNRKFSKIAVTMAGITIIVPAAIVAGLTVSGASAGNSSSLLAMDGARTAADHPGAGLPLTGAAWREVAVLKVRAGLAAERAAERAGDRRAARRAAQRRAQQAATAATPPPSPSSQNSGGPVPQPSGNPQQIASAMLGSYGWSSSEFGCLVSLWNLESGWNVYAANPSSGAYGIPQALPGSKMASSGADWQTNPATQINWGLGYIKSTYGTPCNAWAFWQANGYY